jgi:hypothetical protein
MSTWAPSTHDRVRTLDKGYAMHPILTLRIAELRQAQRRAVDGRQRRAPQEDVHS